VSIVVTGAGGLVGRHLLDVLPATDVVPLVHRGSSANVKGTAVDLAAPDFVAALPKGADTIVHLAQSVHYQEFPDRADDIFAVNVASTARLLDWSRRNGVRRFILASAGGVDRPAAEGRPNFYLATRRSAELLAHGFRDHFTVIVLRFFFVYGPGQRSSMLMPRLIRSVREGLPIALSGSDGLQINPVHARDAAAAVAAATALTDHATIDIAGPEVLSLRAIGELIGRKVGRPPVFTASTSGAEPLTGDITAMSRLLVRPTRTLDGELGELLA
jgi:nucleoside-diphosphate-sugar epimerase